MVPIATSYRLVAQNRRYPFLRKHNISSKKKPILNKNEENTLKEQNEIFLTIWFASVNFYQTTMKSEIQATWTKSPLTKD